MTLYDVWCRLYEQGKFKKALMKDVKEFTADVVAFRCAQPQQQQQPLR